ncbi:MBL fold metallo-hydrolase [Candidatus Micrarchaeota archaeon]|nr:MBL fold metallo-hydrolase [Candidatus Micrarchaeota archaeon]
MKITILGSGDTRGLPKVGCDCATCRQALESGFERKRFGLLVESNETNVLIDASPDLRRAMLQHGFSSKDLDAVLLTHEHYDHVAGLGDFFYEGNTVPLYARPDCIAHVFSEHAYGYLRGFRLFDFHKVDWLTPFSIGGHSGIKITTVPVSHSIETAGFVLEDGGKKVAVLTDCRSDVPPETMDAIRGCDLLLTDGWLESVEQFKHAYRPFHPELSDAQFDAAMVTKTRNHLLIPEATALAEKTEAKKTVLLHVAHSASPHAVLSKRFDSATLQIGFDGLVLGV